MRPEFSLQGLLSKDKDGKTKGAMSPVMFAQEMVFELDDLKLDGLARVSFDDTKIHNINEGGRGLTGHDTLLNRKNR